MDLRSCRGPPGEIPVRTDACDDQAPEIWREVSRRRHWVTIKKLAEFFTSVEGQERLRKQHLKDLATRRAAEPRGAKAVADADYAI